MPTCNAAGALAGLCCEAPRVGPSHTFGPGRTVPIAETQESSQPSVATGCGSSRYTQSSKAEARSEAQKPRMSAIRACVWQGSRVRASILIARAWALTAHPDSIDPRLPSLPSLPLHTFRWRRRGRRDARARLTNDRRRTCRACRWRSRSTHLMKEAIIDHQRPSEAITSFGTGEPLEK